MCSGTVLTESLSQGAAIDVADFHWFLKKNINNNYNPNITLTIGVGILL